MPRNKLIWQVCMFDPKADCGIQAWYYKKEKHAQKQFDFLVKLVSTHPDYKDFQIGMGGETLWLGWEKSQIEEPNIDNHIY